MAVDTIEPVRRTRSFEEGKRNLDECGVTIHENFLAPKLLHAVQERLAEQAAMEREEGVAWFDGEAVKSKSVKGFIKPESHIGKPKGQAPFQNISFLPNKGRVFIDLAKNPDVLGYVRHHGQHLRLLGQIRTNQVHRLVLGAQLSLKLLRGLRRMSVMAPDMPAGAREGQNQFAA